MEKASKSVERLTLTVAEVAQMLGIGLNNAYSLVGSGRLPSVKIGRQIRVSKKVLEDWLDRESGISRENFSY